MVKVRRLRALPLVLAAVMAVALVGCGGSAKPAAKAASKWLPDAEQLVKEARGRSALQALHLGDEAGRSRLSHVLEEAPKQPTADESTALARLRALRSFYAAVDEAGRAADSLWQNAESGVPTVATTAASDARPEVIDHLTEHGRSIL